MRPGLVNLVWNNPARIFKDAKGRKVIKVIRDDVEPWQWTQGFDFVITKKGELKLGSGHGFLGGHTPNVNPKILGAGKIKIDKKRVRLNGFQIDQGIILQTRTNLE